MNKILLGLLLGTVLGAVDGLSAWFTPAVRAQIVGIVVGSTIKGLILLRNHPAGQHRRHNRGLRHAALRTSASRPSDYAIAPTVFC